MVAINLTRPQLNVYNSSTSEIGIETYKIQSNIDRLYKIKNNFFLRKKTHQILTELHIMKAKNTRALQDVIEARTHLDNLVSSWPNDYKGLLTKIIFDSEFNTSLEFNKSLDTGLDGNIFDEYTQLLLSPVVIEKWDVINPENRAKCSQMIIHLLRYHKTNIRFLNLLNNKEKLDLFVHFFPEGQQKNRLKNISWQNQFEG